MAENNLIENGRLVYCKSHWIGGVSGALTAVAAQALVYGLRNITNEELVVSKFVMKFFTTVPFTAPQGLGFALYKATLVSADFSGGIAINPTRKRVGDHVLLPVTETSVQIANAGALAGGGTFAFDADDPIDVMTCGSNNPTAAATTADMRGESVWTPGNQVPISLTANEGLVVVPLVTMGAAGVGKLFIGVDVHKA